MKVVFSLPEPGLIDALVIDGIVLLIVSVGVVTGVPKVPSVGVMRAYTCCPRMNSPLSKVSVIALVTGIPSTNHS